MTPRLRRLVTGLLAGVGLSVLTLGIVAVVPLVQGRAGWAIPVATAVGVGAVGTWLLHDLLRHHFEDLRLLHTALALLARGEVPPKALATRWDSGKPDEVGQMARLVLDMASRRAVERGLPDRRLAAVLAALGDAVVVITESGQISLINAVGKALLGHDRAAVGTSIYAALDRDGLAAALAAARQADGRPVAAAVATVEGDLLHPRLTSLAEHGGTVLTIAAREVEHYAGIDHALDLHDRPPAAPPPTPDTPLAELPGLVLDTETTGLDVVLDRMCSIGWVRVHGARVYKGVTVDRLVHPGRAIPARATAVHGITNAMVAEVPGPAAVLEELLPLLRRTVLIGHNTGFDMAMLRTAAAECGLAWQDPPFLDLLPLCVLLEPDEGNFNLEALALRHGVDVSGRHTALGDALVTAGIFVRLLPKLAARGVESFGQAVAFQQSAGHVIAQQRRAGW